MRFSSTEQSIRAFILGITYDLMLRRLLNIVKIYTLRLLFGILYVKNSLMYMSVKSHLPDLKFKFQRTSDLDGQETGSIV